MKQIIYLMAITLVLSSCSDSASAEQAQDGQEDTEQQQTSFPVEGYEFYGTAEVNPEEAVTVEVLGKKFTADYEKGTPLSLDFIQD